MDGLTFTKTLKNDPRLCIIPIFMLSAKGEEADIVTGLELGADDYITQPFSPKVMIARVRAALRRHKEEPQDEMAIAKHIAQAHGVHVTVKSKLGEGSRFSIHLPQNKWVIFFPKSQLFHCFASLNVVLPRQLKY